MTGCHRASRGASRGGTYSSGWSYPINGQEVTGGPLTILELVPNRLLVTDWPDWRGDPAMPMQRIEWHLEPAGNSTLVPGVQAGFSRAADLSDYPLAGATSAARSRDSWQRPSRRRSGWPAPVESWG